jgi:hypothetical protein
MRPKLVLASCALFFTDFRPVLNFFPKNGAVFYCRRFQAFYLGLPFDGGTIFCLCYDNPDGQGAAIGSIYNQSLATGNFTPNCASSFLEMDYPGKNCW